MTVEALTTQMAPPPATPTNTMEPATATPMATATLMIPTLNLTPLTLSTSATLVPLPTNSAGGGQCNKAVFVQDVTIPDNTLMAYDQEFKKTWKIQNTGSCTWTGTYYASMVSNDPADPEIHGEGTIPVTVNVAPGAIWQYSANLIAPKANGTYTQYWNMVDDTGTPFTSQPWYVKIKVNKSGSGSSSGELYYSSSVSVSEGSGSLDGFGTITLHGDVDDMTNPTDEVKYYYNLYEDEDADGVLDSGDSKKDTDGNGTLTFDATDSQSADPVNFSCDSGTSYIIELYVANTDYYVQNGYGAGTCP